MQGKNLFLVNKSVTFGMQNRGNTCFFNSVMQCLAHTIPLHQFCLKDEKHIAFCQKKSHNQKCLLCAYMLYIRKADSTQRTQTQIIEPFMRKILPSYSFGMQEDA